MIELHCKDNLELLREMSDDLVDLVYCDVLFGTSNKFTDYKDLSRDKHIVFAFYVPRIEEMYRVLKKTGTIYIHCDYRISHWLRTICDDLFGLPKNEIIWHYNSAPRKSLCFGKRHDTILRYSKSEVFTFNEDEVREPYSLSAPRGYEKEKYYNDKGKVMGDVWQIPILGQNDKTERVGYATQKPEFLLNRIVVSSSNKNDLVADFFLGSGTTAVVCKKTDRNFIGCDINPKSISVTEERLAKC